MTSDTTFEQASVRHRAGELAAARRLYEQHLERAPADALGHFRLGLLEFQEGHGSVALARIERAIALAPLEARFEIGRGQVCAALGALPAAAAAFDRALALEPESVDAAAGLGAARAALGDPRGAIVAYAAALARDPARAEVANNLGNCLQAIGDLAAAEESYRRAVAAAPEFAAAIANLGTVLVATRRAAEAVPLLRQAHELEPGTASHAINLGIALCQLREFGPAAAVLAAAEAAGGSPAEAAFNLGIALDGRGEARAAAAAYERACAARADYADALNNLGNVRKALGEFDAAAAAYAAAIRARPEFAAAFNNAGCLARTRGRIEEAADLLRRGLALDPASSVLNLNLGNVEKDAGDLPAALASFRRALALDPDNLAAHANLAYSLGFAAETGAEILAECRRLDAHFARALTRVAPPHANERTPERRLRIGYVSPDFRDHCQSLFTLPLFAHHDHAAFEIHCYSSVEREDALTARIRGLSDRFEAVRALDDAALAERVRADRIDILVDLTMHMADGRPLLFARRPAPVQVAWLAYPGTTGLEAMDARLTDRWLDPPGSDADYSERSLRLRDAFWCYDPLTAAPEPGSLPALARGHVTFGCLNNPCKLTDRTLALWGRVLAALPGARLLLMAPPGPYRGRLLERARAAGLDAARIEFVGFRPRAEYLASYRDIDIGLDTLPYNGHTTSLDSFWMGVPVVTLGGATCVGRGGLSQLHALGLPELAAAGDAEFVDVATRLARDLPRLERLRRTLRERLARSPLMDAPRFARSMEAAYRTLWRGYCGSPRPRHGAPPGAAGLTEP